MDLVTEWIGAAEAQLDRRTLEASQENAIIRLFELAAQEPDSALKIIYAIVQRKPRSDVLNYLGAGPIEELLVKHCEYLNEFISRARSDSLLKQCLSHVNLEVDDCADAPDLQRFLGASVPADRGQV